MEIIINIDMKEIQEMVNQEVREFVRRKIDDDIIGDAMSKHWAKIDEEIDAYVETPDFHVAVRAAIQKCEPALLRSIKDRITGNF